MFFQVMAQFIVPLFLACVLLVVFQPLHRWFLSKLPKWPRIAALLTTITILLTVLVPTIYLGWNAYHETVTPDSKPRARSRSASKAGTGSNRGTGCSRRRAKDENTLYATLVCERSTKWAEDR